MKSAAGRLKVQVLDDQTLPEVGEEPGALATLRLPHQDRRRHLGVELGGAERRGAGRRRVAGRADPEVNSSYHRCALLIFHLQIDQAVNG